MYIYIYITPTHGQCYLNVTQLLMFYGIFLDFMYQQMIKMFTQGKDCHVVHFEKLDSWTIGMGAILASTLHFWINKWGMAAKSPELFALTITDNLSCGDDQD